MIVLAVDTCLGACSAAVIDDDRVLAAVSEPMMRGHQERLAPMVEALMARAGVGFSRLDRVAVTVGPGSFTGLRVGLAFAKGMATALDIPCVGVGSLEALASGETGRIIACADARHGQLYWQAFDGGRPLAPPALSPMADVAATGAPPDALAGPAAGLLASAFPRARVTWAIAPDPVSVGRIALSALTAPVPLYLRPPDAKLPGGVTPSW
jgi:tRNA threonylcarbamoyladenosine biosynthesis protein TsaB